MNETTGHLPECFHGHPESMSPGFLVPCICDRLRACKQRVRGSAATLWDRTSEQMAAARVEGYAAGLNAAREAVWESAGPGADAFSAMVFGRALAAIDALREGPK